MLRGRDWRLLPLVAGLPFVPLIAAVVASLGSSRTEFRVITSGLSLAQPLACRNGGPGRRLGQEIDPYGRSVAD